MKITYKKYKNMYGVLDSIVLKFIDGVHVLSIPFDKDNIDYQEYLKWCNGELPYTEKGTAEDAD